MNKALGIFLTLLILLASCKTTKHLTGGPSVKPEKMPAMALLDSVNKHHVDFKWLSFKARIDYSGNKRSENFTANIRMRKDSVIWASITSLMGVEVARILVTKDSVEVLDRIKKVHTKKPISFLEQYVPFPLNISLLQDLLAGNYLLNTDGELRSKVEKDELVLQAENDKLTSEYIIGPVSYLLKSMSLKDKASESQVSVDIKNYNLLDEHEFSDERTLNFRAKKNKVKMHMRISKITWNEPLTFPFFISDKYD